MKRSFLVCIVLALGAGTAAAQEVGPRLLVLSPARPTGPALHNRLLPELIEQRPGNAADHYSKIKELLQGATKPTNDQIEVWLKAPLNKLPLDEMRAALKDCGKAMAEAEAGARCESCDWGVAEEIRKHGIGFRADFIQDTRELTTLFTLRLRLELAEGRTDRALHTVKTMLSMARHVGQGPTLISMLVGAAETAIILDRLEEVLQQPDAPNLYWALTDLPRPFFDLRQALQGERLIGYNIFLTGFGVDASDLDAGPMSKEQLQKLTKGLVGLSSEATGVGNRWLFGALVLSRHEEAKRTLIAAGRPRDKVEAMPHLQVALLHALLDYDRELDEMMKWQSQPFWESRPALEAREQELKQQRFMTLLRNDAPALPFAGFLLPALVKVSGAGVRIDRRIALLRCVEGVRLYAAEHDGKLPASLAEVKGVPLPIDPATGKAFHYEVKGASARLSAPPQDGKTNLFFSAPSYDLILRK
jgi:hypothetical protein